MQTLGPRDVNRVAGPVPRKRPEKHRLAEGPKSKNARVKRQRNEPHTDYMSTTRKPPSFLYTKAASTQIDIDFPMFYKTE